MREILFAGRSHPGRRRSHNEDRWLADALGGVFLVADGLGGAAGGELAAELIVEAAPPLLRKHMRGISNLADSRAEQRLQTAIGELNLRVWSEGQRHARLRGMGATLVLALVREQQALIAHVGDSRAYRYHEDQLQLLTKDHSTVQRLLDEGQITPQQANDHPLAGQLTRYVGQDKEVVADICFCELELDDRLLLCSDGLSGMIGDGEIQGILQLNLPPEETCGLLIDSANLMGGDDNITTVLLWM